MIVVIVGRQDGIDLANRKGIKDKWRSTQVGLQFLHPRHTLHLMSLFHQRIAMALLAGATPEVDANIGSPL